MRRLRSIPLALGFLFGGLSAAESGNGPFAPELELFVRSFKPGGQDLAGQATVPPAAEALRRMVLAPGYRVELVAAEPTITQPLDLHFDERGRLWVVEYRQYPYPAGVRITGYDQYLRAEYDRLPPPPPRHVRGADRITILEDRDGDGRFETSKVFLDGLNLATSVLPGDGGVWVLHSPYLLFYPDRDGDDFPDGDPEVHLAGFGLEDTHSLASSLHWGPDGWIYGAKGSTATLEIQGVKLLGQGIWRYHPGTRRFEVFAEGGGNTFSVEFDREGRLFSGTNTGGTRGLHYAQGATYVKGWSKHGPAMNPFIFGFFEHMEHQGYTQRFPQAFMIYEGGAMPALEGQVVVGMALTNRMQASRLVRSTSTFRTEDTDALVTTGDRTFRPVDVECGPDGAIYIADWTDARLSHLNPADTWDKSNGRIYRLVADGVPRRQVRDLRRATGEELLALLADPNRELREQSRRLLGSRAEPAAALLRARVVANGPDALECFWVLNLRGELAEPELRGALRHPLPRIREWAVRLLGDRCQVDAVTAGELARLAGREPDVEVRVQLACSLKRLPGGVAWPALRALVTRDEDAADGRLPLLLWWAVESKAETAREELLAWVADPAMWRSRIFAEHLAVRIGRRFTADQGPRRHWTLSQGVYSDWIIERAPEHFVRNLDFCGRLLAAVPGRREADLLLAGMAEGFTGEPMTEVPASLRAALASCWAQGTPNAALIAVAARAGRTDALEEAVARLRAGALPEADRKRLLDLVAVARPAAALPWLIEQVTREKNEARRMALLAALGGFRDPAVGTLLRRVYAQLTPRSQASVQRLLCEEPGRALATLEAVNRGEFDPGAFSSANLALLRGHADPRIRVELERHLAVRAGDVALQGAQRLFETGRVAYSLTCAPCHQEAGEGRVGLAPALVGSRWLQAGDDWLVRIVLHGKENVGRGFVMPPWRQLEDAQLAAILTFIKREFGNQARAVDPQRVGAVRAATADRTKPWTDDELDALRGAGAVPSGAR
jgi:putative membrane-bound dehydrogenase-like protein